MAVQDPGIYEFCSLTATEDQATSYARQRGLLLSEGVLQQAQRQQQQQPQCLLGTVGCNGDVHPAKKHRADRGKDYEGFRCTKCKKFRCAKNALVQGEIRGAAQGNELRSFFATLGADGKSHTKVSIKAALAVIYFWAKDLSMLQTQHLLPESISGTETYVNWRNYIREVCQRSLNDAPPMGGPGEIVQIDESLMRGRRKYNRGRLLRGNRVPPARQNYGNQVVGPWIFGMVWKRPDGKQDLRMFHVLRHNELTLRPIIERHIAPGTLIRSDEWAAYRNISTWQGFNYVHETVNHQENFVDPITGANTQRIECHWGHVKTEILRKMRGTSPNLLPGHLAAYWWKKMHNEAPFNTIVDEIATQFPLI